MKHLKQEFDKLTFKEILTYGMAIASLVAGFALLFCGMFIPPRGEIHPTVLSSFGVILLFVGSVLGIEMRYADKSKQFRDEIFNYINNINKQSQKL